MPFGKLTLDLGSLGSNKGGGGGGGGAYSGPGDVVSGATMWWGLRAYSFASIGGNICDIKRASDNTTQTFVSLTDGSLDVASIATFLTSTTGTVTKLYDQTGNLNDLTSSAPPGFSLNVIASRPAMHFDGSQGLHAAIADPGATFTITAVAERTSGSTYSHIFAQAGVIGIFFNGTNVLDFFTAGDHNLTANENTFHAIQAISNGASSILNADGTSGSPFTASTAWGANADLGADTGASGSGETLTGYICEAGLWASGFTGTQVTNMNSNQKTYWGF